MMMIAEKIHLEADEKILMRVRKNWFILFIQVLSVLVVAILPPALYLFVKDASLAESITSSYTGALVALYTGWLLVMWMTLGSIWTNYYLDVWTVTNKRLIAVDQKGFFFRTTASFRLERLQDIIVSVNGIVATLLDYGSLEIQTAGNEKNFKANGLPHPGALKAVILSSTDTLIKEQAPTEKAGV
jgi:hypothetical protein